MRAYLRDAKVRALAIQVALVGFVLLLLAGLILSTIANLKARGIPLGFDFLNVSAGLPIAESFLAFDPDEPYSRAILVGLVNTLVISLAVIVLASIAGLFLGIGRLSSNPLVAGLCRLWVEIARNTPAIVLLLFLYALWWQVLPAARDALQLAPGAFLSQRGLVLPRLGLDGPGGELALLLASLVALLLLAARRARRIREAKGRQPPYVALAWGVAGGALVFAALSGRWSLTAEIPEFRRLNFVGGVEITPELTTIVIGLTLYTAGFIAEIVRAGILAIGKGQWEAGRSLGLTGGQLLRLVVIPQTLRIIVPPMTSQYINVVKNSTLAIAVGFQDFMTIMQTIINQTAHAVEGVAIILGVYLILNLSLSALLNAFNRRIALVER